MQYGDVDVVIAIGYSAENIDFWQRPDGGWVCNTSRRK